MCVKRRSDRDFLDSEIRKFSSKADHSRRIEYVGPIAEGLAEAFNKTVKDARASVGSTGTGRASRVFAKVKCDCKCLTQNQRRRSRKVRQG